MKYQKYLIKDVATLKYGKNQKKVSDPKGTIPIYGTGGIIEFGLKPLYNGESVIIGRKGSKNIPQYIDGPFWAIDTVYYCIFDKSKVIPKYFYYLICQVELEKLDEGTSLPSYKKETLDSLAIEVPPLHYQSKVVSFMELIEREIELKTAQNRNLELMGNLIVKKVFTSPDKEIRLKEKLSFINGFPFKSKEYVESGKYGIVTIKNVKDGILDQSSLSYIDNLPIKLSSECFLAERDVLLSLTGNVGRVAIVDCPNLLLNQRVAKLKPKNKEDLGFFYFLFRQKDIKDQLDQLARGTAQKNLSPIETLEIRISFNKKTFLEERDTFNLFLNTILTNRKEIIALQKIRDLLLPKLLFGEIEL